MRWLSFLLGCQWTVLFAAGTVVWVLPAFCKVSLQVWQPVENPLCQVFFLTSALYVNYTSAWQSYYCLFTVDMCLIVWLCSSSAVRFLYQIEAAIWISDESIPLYRVFLGSVSNYCINHVGCPVVVIKGTWDSLSPAFFGVLPFKVFEVSIVPFVILYVVLLHNAHLLVLLRNEGCYVVSFIVKEEVLLVV